MDIYHYILKDKKIIPIEIWIDGKINQEKLDEWATWFGNIENRKVDFSEIGNIRISTVFLGIDHNFSFLEGHEPILFETAIIQDDDFEIVERYKTYDDAKKGHKSWKNSKLLTSLKIKGST